MNNWKIKSLYYGKVTASKGIFSAGLDPDIILEIPYIGYLLQNGTQNILVDTGIHEDIIVDGKGWGGLQSEGGNNYVVEALEKEGLTVKDIDTVIYTHLHHDHTGGVLLFPEAVTYYQKDEFLNLLNSLPTQKMRSDYSERTVADLSRLKNHFMVDGDIELTNGLKFYKIPGHTLGSMAIVVPTSEGKYVITGDIPHLGISLFPKLDKMQLMDGSIINITPAPDNMMPYLFSSVIYDQYSAFDSYNNLKVLAEEFNPKWYLTGHDPWIIAKHNFG